MYLVVSAALIKPEPLNAIKVKITVSNAGKLSGNLKRLRLGRRVGYRS
jgi:hypothetical protein